MTPFNLALLDEDSLLPYILKYLIEALPIVQ